MKYEVKMTVINNILRPSGQITKAAKRLSLFRLFIVLVTKNQYQAEGKKLKNRSH